MASVAVHTLVGFDKMTPWTTLVVLCSVFSYVIAGPGHSVQCKISDDGCLKMIIVDAFSKILGGDPALGTENLDPMHHDEIDGNLSILKYKMTDTTVTGFKDCKIEDLKLNTETHTMKLEMFCPKFTVTGKYDIHGRLIILPVEGNGDFTIHTNKYKITVETVTKTEPGKDGKTYFSLKSFKHTAEPLEGVKYDFKNLFNGQKDLADAVLKYANENWYEVTKEFQDPIFKANIKKLIKNVNKYYKRKPIEDLVSY